MRNSFGLVLLLHILLFICFSTNIIFSLEKKHQLVPDYVPQKQMIQQSVPAYFYNGSVAITQPIPAQKVSQPKPTPVTAPSEQVAEIKPSSRGIKKVTGSKAQSILAMSRAAIRQDFTESAIRNTSAEEPILLVGDHGKTVDPIVKLLGKSLSAHFKYPKIQGMFGARDTVYIRFVLHPEGFYSNVQIVRSSEIEDFNRAALYAVNSAPTVVGINKFLPSPKSFLVGFIFD